MLAQRREFLALAATAALAPLASITRAPAALRTNASCPPVVARIGRRLEAFHRGTATQIRRDGRPCPRKAWMVSFWRTSHSDRKSVV